MAKDSVSGQRSRSFSVRWRVVLISAIGTAVPVFVATLFLAGFFVSQLRDGLEQKGRSLARFAAANLSAALDFDDQQAAADIISGLIAGDAPATAGAPTAGSDPDLVYALVLKRDGTRFAARGAEPPAAVPRRAKTDDVTAFEAGGQLHLVAPIRVAGKPAGVVQLGFSFAEIDLAARNVRLGGFAVALGLTLVVTLILVFGIGRAVVLPVERMTQMVQRLGRGDLRRSGLALETSSATEIETMREAVQRSAEAFRQSVRAISAVSAELAESAVELSESTDQLASASNEQAVAMSETSTTMTEIDQTGRAAARQAERIAVTADQSVEQSQEGLLAVDDSLARFRAIDRQMAEIVTHVDQLGRQLVRVDEIVVSVAEIAHKSQLLAINASIEAAKAGAVGRGFAVVAREVREMALQSKAATEQVSATLESIRHGIGTVANSSRGGQRATQESVGTVERAGTVIRKMAGVIQQTAGGARQIATNVGQQSTGLEQVMRAVTEIHDATQHNLERVASLGQRGRVLHQRAAELEQLVSRFRLED